jgi:hypothetical protein
MNRDADGCETAIHRATSSGGHGAVRRLGVARHASVLLWLMAGAGFTAGSVQGRKTLKGIERIRQAVTKHGRHSKRAKAERESYRKLLRDFRQLLTGIPGV